MVEIVQAPPGQRQNGSQQGPGLPRSILFGLGYFGLTLAVMIWWSLNYGASLAVKEPTWSTVELYILPALFLLIPILLYILFPSLIDTTIHGRLQSIILIITIASFYAFGWPRSLQPADMNHAFAELCVIVVLFLLAELASYLTIASQHISASLDETGNSVTRQLARVSNETVAGVQEKLKPVSDEINKLGTILQPQKLIESVNALKDIFSVVQTVQPLQDPTAKDLVLTEISKYSASWASFLHSLEERDDDPKRLRVDCGSRLLRKYVQTEIADGINPGHRQIVTVDELYGQILQQVLEALEARAVKGEKVFAWAITNVPPYGFYHWGEKYGHPGSLKFMDDFRKAVADLVSKNQSYERLFLFRNDARPGSEKATAGLSLVRNTDIAKFANYVLLLVRRDDEPTSQYDLPHPKSVWSDLKVWENIEGHADDDDAKFYGIIPTEVCSKQHPSWELNVENKVHIEGVYSSYRVLPVPFLDHFAQMYQSANGMMFLPVSAKSALPEQIENNPDCLILGTVDAASEPHPVIAVSSSVVPTARTMKMDVFTADTDLKELKEFWAGAKQSSQSLQELLAASAGQSNASS